MNFLIPLSITCLYLTQPFISGRNKQTVKCIKSEEIIENPPFSSCHAATLVEIRNNEIMTAWFGGSYEGSNDVCIWGAVYTKGYWTKPQKLASGKQIDGSELPCWNPVLFKTRFGKLLLFYKVGKNPREWWGEVIVSTNDGKTWGEKQILPPGFLGPVKNKPLQLGNGNILCPSSTESVEGNIWKVQLEITNETLDKWEMATIDSVTNKGVIQPTILFHSDGNLQMLCRSSNNRIMQTWSGDNGKIWLDLTATELPNPNSGIDAVTLSDNSFLLVYNPLLSGSEWYNGRNKLKLAYSQDGLHWSDVYTLEDGDDGEFSYPAIIQTSDRLIHIVYTLNRKNIKHVVLQLN